ncbi:MAG: HD domain-containing protein [Actinomycetota bacterium]
MTEPDPRWVAGPLFASAMELAVKHHARQARKRDNEPYIGHLLSVAGNVIEAGGSEVQAAAALLHDINEDQHVPFETIADRVSPQVAAIVESCSEEEEPEGANRKASWGTRKQEALGHLRAMDSADPALLVKLADKVNNSEKAVRDFARWKRETGSADGFWGEFNAGDSCQQWWYGSLLAGFREKEYTPLGQTLLDRFADAVDALFGGRTVAQCTVDHGHGTAVQG